MTEIMDGTSIAEAFEAAVAAHADRPFLAVPAHEGRAYLPAGFEITYGEAGRQIEALAALYRRAGYGVGHRVATLLKNSASMSCTRSPSTASASAACL